MKLKRGSVITIKLDDAAQTGDAIEGWAVSRSPGSWGARKWVAIKDAAGQQDLAGGFRARYLGACTGPKGLPGLLFDQRVDELLPRLSVTPHRSWPL
jgi:hypothetical protein|tara:strand:- start:2528 stop:2818 length:291 start_codon:yes stop_codon:yes gene_type:complete